KRLASATRRNRRCRWRIHDEDVRIRRRSVKRLSAHGDVSSRGNKLLAGQLGAGGDERAIRERIAGEHARERDIRREADRAEWQPPPHGQRQDRDRELLDHVAGTIVAAVEVSPDVAGQRLDRDDRTYTAAPAELGADRGGAVHGRGADLPVFVAVEK